MAATVAEVMNSKFQGLSESLSKFDEKLDRKFAELLAAIRLLTSSRTVGASSSGDRCPPSHSQVLQPPVHDLARIDKRSLSDDVSDGVVAKKCSLGTDFLNPILCESFPIEVLRSADGGLKECKSESAIINKTEKITITEDDTNDEGSLNDVLDEPAAINDVESEVNIIDECSCDARLLDVVSNKHDGVEEVKHEVNSATIQFNNSPGLSSFKDSRVCLAKSVYKPVYQVVICSVIYCSPTVCLNAHEKLVLYFLRAKPPDMNRRTRHGLVLSSIQHNLIKPRTCPEVSIMDIEATLGLWCSEAPPWPPDARKWLIMISKLHKRAHTVAGNILQVFAKIENFELSFQNILNEFDDVFIEPTELPPYRGDHDHRIHLLEWRHYFLAGRFTIETDQRSFKYLQEQRLNTLVQQHWLNGGIIPDEVWCLETPPWPPDVTKLLIMHLTLPKRSGVDGFNTMQVKGILGYTLSPAKPPDDFMNSVQKIVYEMSEGSKYFEHEERKEALMKQRIEKIVMLEATRDLTWIWFHVDMDAFYAAVETLSNLSLKGKLMVVGSLPMICTANYEAQKFGVCAAMPGFIARKLRSALILVPTNLKKYTHDSDLTRRVFQDYDPKFLAASLDEAYLDITEPCKARSMSEAEIVDELRVRIYEKTGLTCSAGVAPNRLLTKNLGHGIDSSYDAGQFGGAFGGATGINFGGSHGFGNGVNQDFIGSYGTRNVVGPNMMVDPYSVNGGVIYTGNCDMVLGILCLATLGTILWNIEHLTMEFKVNQRKLISKLVTQNAHLAMICVTNIEATDELSFFEYPESQPPLPNDIEVVFMITIEDEEPMVDDSKGFANEDVLLARNVQLAMLCMDGVAENEQCNIKPRFFEHTPITSDIDVVLTEFERVSTDPTMLQVVEQWPLTDLLKRERIKKEIIGASLFYFSRCQDHQKFLHSNLEVKVLWEGKI